MSILWSRPGRPVGDLTQQPHPRNGYRAGRLVLVAAMVATAALTALGAGARASHAAAGVIANPGGPYRGSVGELIQFNGGDSTGINLGFSWDFGDGSTAVGAVVDHVYGVAGVHTVILTVTDPIGQTARASTTATISGGYVVEPCVVPYVNHGLCSDGRYPYWLPGVFPGFVPGIVPGIIPSGVPGCTWTGHGVGCPPRRPINCAPLLNGSSPCILPPSRPPFHGPPVRLPGVYPPGHVCNGLVTRGCVHYPTGR